MEHVSLFLNLFISFRNGLIIYVHQINNKLLKLIIKKRTFTDDYVIIMIVVASLNANQMRKVRATALFQPCNLVTTTE